MHRCLAERDRDHGAVGLSRRAPAGLRDASVSGSGLQVPPAAGTAFLDVVRCSVAVHCSGSWGSPDMDVALVRSLRRWPSLSLIQLYGVCGAPSPKPLPVVSSCVTAGGESCDAEYLAGAAAFS